MGFVTINKEYRVAVEDKVLTLQKYKGINKKTDNEIWDNVGYYSDWESVGTRLLKMVVAEEIDLIGTVTINELKAIVTDAKRFITGLIKEEIG